MKRIILIFVLCLTCITLFGCQNEKKPATAYEIAVANGFTGSEDEWLASLKGEKGNDGVGIVSIEKTGTENNVDTYTITFSNGTTSTFNITNGINGSNGVAGLSAYELYKKYHSAYDGTEEDWIEALASGSLANSYNTSYNVIWTLASIPPVLAALDSVNSGLDTYAIIERGKTYNGIDNLPNFYNVGFNASNNTSAGFSAEQFDKMVKQIKELNEFGNEKFTIYVQDGTALQGLALAANAKLKDNQYKIVMLEDGTGAYSSFKNNVLGNKTLNGTTDGYYTAFLNEVNSVKSIVDNIKSKNDNQITDSVFNYNIPRAFYLSALDNFVYWLQDETQIVNILEAKNNGSIHTKLLSVFNIAGYEDEVELNVNLRYESISHYVDNLSSEDKELYLKLMYGSYYDDTYNTLTRTTLFDGSTPVPSEKLVFVGSRVNGYPKIVSNATYGIGGVTSADQVPDNYADLDAKYKNELLFANESDYTLFINQIKLDSNYTNGITDEQKAAVRIACFNYYVDYMYTLKMVYKLYGNNFDIIMKGHPREVIGAYTEWTSHYVASGYTFDKLMDNVCIAFHESDSIGKYIGMVPYGTAAENLAYLGTELSICGLPSSTYTGYDTDVDVQFVINLTNGNITTDSNLKVRYEAGNLTYEDNGEIKTTKFYNVGLVYKTLASIFENNSDLHDLYQSLFVNWLKAQTGQDDVSNYDVDNQGYVVEIN